ncbi:hypothetical protein A6R68_11423, partial [Neotoma lepida]
MAPLRRKLKAKAASGDKADNRKKLAEAGGPRAACAGDHPSQRGSFEGTLLSPDNSHADLWT